MLPHRRLLYCSNNSSFRAFLNNFHDVIFTSFVSSFDRRGRVDRHIHYFFFFIRPRYIIIDVPASWSGVFCCESLHHHFQVARTYTLRQKAYPRISNGESLSFFHARGKEEQRSHETVSKAADTGRGGGSRALVAWLDRHAALPRDTLLKQRTTLKFSESTGSVCKGNKS